MNTYTATVERLVGRPLRRLLTGTRLLGLGLVIACAFVSFGAPAETLLADAPLFATINVPGNLVLALSVEFPTAVTAADRNAYSTIKTYLGYFDPLKCYSYRVNEVDNGSYFHPDGATDSNFGCSGKWSGNFMNWAAMQAVDPFRSALTGGYRNIDSPTTTILEKAWAPSNQGSSGNNFPNQSLSAGVSSATPFSSANFHMHVLRCGNLMVFSLNGSLGGDDCPSSPTAWDGVVANTTAAGIYSVQVRVQVCVIGSLESNCVQYGSNYKPQGLIQKYANKIRYSAFGYLNDPAPTGGSNLRDGGVMRARMKFVGPTQPVPGSTAIANVVNAVAGQVTAGEWSATDGTFVPNPDTADASSSSETGSVVALSGVINYLNQFGHTSKAYKYFDPVSELYYAATRYLRNKGDVPEYSDLTRFNGGASGVANRTAMKDGFPVITPWVDPILYSCQKNYVLGIGDTNSNQDKDVPGNTTWRVNEPTMPDTVTSDNIDAVAATNKVGVIEGIGSSIGNTDSYNTSNNSAYMAGMAYLFNTTDIRSDLAGVQTISTFWLDVLEGSDYKAGPGGRNQFYLATKYGGFTVPTGYSYATNTTTLPQAQWSTNGDTIPIPSGNGPRPDNYFVADQSDKMVAGLSTAFSRIATGSGATTTSFSLALPQVTALNNASYSSTYDPATWTGDVNGSSIDFNDSHGVPLDSPAMTTRWTFSTQLAAQVAGTGWNTNRRVVTWNGTAGVPFRSTASSPGTAVATADLGALDTSYVTGDDRVNYLNYLRGDTSNEAASTATGSTHAYRTRTKLVGDIVGSKAQPVGPPSFPYSDTTNPGYADFRSTWATRRTVVYAGSNDGMMHAINGALVSAQPTPAPAPPLEQDSHYGQEMFAYVPHALFQGPSSLATPNANGLASLGNPSFSHHNLVNATPNVYDIDFNKTPGVTGSPEWHSVLIGGLGKGGRSYYAIDVTDPQSMVTGGEGAVAGKVLWEFTDPSLGFTYGEPLVTKTKRYGWVVVFASGYNNSDGQGYFLFVDPRTGILLEKVPTGQGSATADAGLAHINAFIVDATDGTADAIYGGDLLGNIWRLDVTATTGTTYRNASSPQNPLAFARLVDAAGNPQPVTSRPAIEVHPSTRQRFVMVGTGQLLDTTDLASTRGQSFYAITDGTNAAFVTSPTAPLAFPITRSMLLQSNDVNAVLGTSAVTFNPITQAGWYQDLGTDSATGIAYRVTTDSTTLSGAVSFAATVSNGDACTPSGTSRVYGRNYAATTSTLTTVISGVISPLTFATVGGNVTDLHYLSVGGKATLIAGSDTSSVVKIGITPAVVLTQRRLNWRELLSD